ncbi:methylamine dehydrogenase (amicyanin) small subunit [Modicisalibacter luteus]|uniref:Methylamine dehydrogenase light chain n=1 Tax=Modicisalibacter luteus TaxID=453962 RepID=A0ABV7M6X3_9GAMM|nr:methylamine dehydrogenase (amicyanin) small subunit [Halomonas lutea]GHA88125.1 hypothetical protein GCM10007159_06920 [Halomonas lutea]
MTLDFDTLVERASRFLANGLSRRHFLSWTGTIVMGSAVLPLLPIDRSGGKARAAESGAQDTQDDDDTQCNYWRYCAIDGYVCSCCGGTPSSCPPGTSPAPTSWVGTCLNPVDGKHYLISYRDCCGKGSCGRCACLGLEGELPAYRAQKNNDIIWCYGAPDMMYHCSSAVVIGEA